MISKAFRNHFLIIYLLCTFQRNKAPNEPTIPLLMPQQHMIASNHSIVSDEINSQDDIHSPLLSTKNSEMNRVEIDLGSLARSNPRNRKNRGENSDQDLQMQSFVDEIRDKSQPLLGKNLHASVLTEIEKGDREWWEMQERGYQVDSLEASGQVGPRTSCHCQVKGFKNIKCIFWYIADAMPTGFAIAWAHLGSGPDQFQNRGV